MPDEFLQEILDSIKDYYASDSEAKYSEDLTVEEVDSIISYYSKREQGRRQDQKLLFYTGLRLRLWDKEQRAIALNSYLEEERLREEHARLEQLKGVRKNVRIYLACPYSCITNEQARERVVERITEIASKFLNEGFLVFSPITHSHSMVPFVGSGDFTTWEALDKSFLHLWATHLVVWHGPCVSMSKGVAAEIDYTYNVLAKPVYNLAEELNNYAYIIECLTKEGVKE